MSAPTPETVAVYLGPTSWGLEVIAAALASEQAAQANCCRIPSQFPPDLAEALCRRVAVNPANRALPLGVQTTLTDMAVATVSVGGYDREVKRLEAPYRKRVVG